MRWALICSALISVVNLFTFFYLRPSQNFGARHAAIARLTSVQGRMEVFDPVLKSWRLLKNGAPLEQRTTIRSGTTARAQLIFEATGDQVMIEPNSVVVVELRNGKNLIEVVSGFVRAEKNNSNLQVIPENAERGFKAERSFKAERNVVFTPPNFIWTSPEKDIKLESEDVMQPLEVAWQPIESGQVEIWTGLSPNNLKLKTKIDSAVGKSSFVPMLGKTYLQGRFSKAGKDSAGKVQPDSSIQFGPLLEITASLTRSFLVVSPDVDLSIVRNDEKPIKIDFSWVASNEVEKFVLTVKSNSLSSPIEADIPSDRRNHSVLINQEGTYSWTLRALSKSRANPPKVQSGRFEIYSPAKNLLSLEKVTPQESALKVYGQISKLDLKWRISDQEKTEPKSKPAKLIYGIELKSDSSREIRKFTTEQDELTVPRVEPGNLDIKIQAFSSTGLELSHPLEFQVGIQAHEAPRWPAGIENAFTLKEISPGAFEASWQPLNSEVEYQLTLKRDGKSVENFSTRQTKHVFRRMQPGRYRLEVLPRGLKNEFVLSPLVETWTVQSESAVEAPQVKKIEVHK
jgi:hypothetical protein